MTGDRLLFNHKILNVIIPIACLVFTSPLMAATVDIDLNSTHQTIRGFGGMNFPRWIGTLTDSQVDTAFGNGPGQIGFTIMRIDVPPNSSDWSDEVSAAARAINNHGAIVFASPWSPPASMKTNGSLIQGELKTDSYDDFANYLTDFANYMSSNGAPLFAVSVQNEPDWLPDYESCGYSPSQMQTFLNNNASVIPTKVVAPETVHYKSDYVSAVASTSECNIVGVHAYGGSITYYLGKEYWMTEHLVLDTNYPAILATGKEIHDCMTANMSAYIWWYIRRSYGPMDESGNVTKRGYVMSHFSKFVRPGYIRVDATENPSSGVYVTAYKNGGIPVIVAINQNSSPSSVTFSLSGGSVDSYTKYETTSSDDLSNMGSVGSTDTLAANSINTFIGVDITSPSAPTGLVATAGDSQVNLDWNDNSEGDLDGYNVYRSTTSGSGYSQINGSLVNDSNYIDYSATPSITYYYVVTAVDTSSNESGYSNEDSATPYEIPPAAPTGLSAIASNGVVWLNWNDNGEGDLDGYNVYRSTTSGSGYTKQNGSLLSSSDYTDTSVTNGITYYYVVTAVDEGANESGYSSEVDATPSGSSSTIYNFEGITQSNTNYNAYACDVDVFPFYGDSDNRNTMVEATDTEYGYISADDTSRWDTVDPGFNDEMLLWVEMKINDFVDDITRIDLTFNGYTGSSGDITHSIYVKKATGDWTNNNSWIQVGSDQNIPGGVDTEMTRVITSDISTYIDETGNIVWALHETTSSESMHINYLEMAVYSTNDPPSAPMGLAATAGDETVSLDWNNNPEGDIDGYNVYRSTTSGSGYSQINGSLLSTSDYTDNSVANGTTYYYVVTAVDTSSNESGYSSEVSATPNIPDSEVEIIGSWTTGTSHAKETGTSRVLIFIAHGESSSSMNLSTVTYGGQSMDKVTDWNYNATSGYAYAAAFILDEAGISAASTNTFNPTWGGTAPGSVAYASVFLANVDQADPCGADDHGGSTSNPVTTDPLTTSDGDMVILAATCGNAGSYILNNGFTEGTDQQFGGTVTGATGHKAATGASETPSATYSSSINRQMIIGFVVKAVSSSGYQNCAEVQGGGFGLVSDLNGNCYVDFWDLDIIADYWLDTDCGTSGNCGGADFAPTDGDVDWEDFSDFAVDWMLCNNPGDSDCIENWLP